MDEIRLGDLLRWYGPRGAYDVHAIGLLPDGRVLVRHASEREPEELLEMKRLELAYYVSEAELEAMAGLLDLARERGWDVLVVRGTEDANLADPGRAWVSFWRTVAAKI